MLVLSADEVCLLELSIVICPEFTDVRFINLKSVSETRRDRTKIKYRCHCICMSSTQLLTDAIVKSSTTSP